MVEKRFKLSARISCDTPSAIKSVLERIMGNEGITKPMSEGFEVSAELDGESAGKLNRILLSSMRKVEKKTRLRAEWTLDDTT